MTNGYLGKVTVDVEPARQAANRPECSLQLQQACTYNGQTITNMPPVTPLSFSVIDFTSFYQNYVGFPPTNAVRLTTRQPGPQRPTLHVVPQCRKLVCAELSEFEGAFASWWCCQRAVPESDCAADSMGAAWKNQL